MAKVLLYYAHPGERFSTANLAMKRRAEAIGDITIVDLYAEYPRHDINIDREQERLAAHDVVVLQHPFFWYSTPSLVKEWLDLVLEYGWAYGPGGDKLEGKRLMQAVTIGGPENAYEDGGYNNFHVRTFLSPMEQSARLCRMEYLAPYVLFGSLKSSEAGALDPHVDGYERLLVALRDDRFDFAAAAGADLLRHDNLPVLDGKAA